MSRKPINKTIKKNKKKFTRRKRNMEHMKHMNKMQSRKRRGGNNRTKRGGVINKNVYGGPTLGPDRSKYDKGDVNAFLKTRQNNMGEHNNKLKESITGKNLSVGVLSDSKPGTPAETSEEDQKGFREPENDYDKLVQTPRNTSQDENRNNVLSEMKMVVNLKNKNNSLEDIINNYKNNSLEEQYKNHEKNEKLQHEIKVVVSSDNSQIKKLKKQINNQIDLIDKAKEDYKKKVKNEKAELNNKKNEYEKMNSTNPKWKEFYDKNQGKTVEQLGKQLTTGHPNQEEKKALNVAINLLREKMNAYENILKNQKQEVEKNAEYAKKAQDVKIKAKEAKEAANRKAKEEEAKEAERKRDEDVKNANSLQLTVLNPRAPVTNNKTSSNNALTVSTEVKSDSQPTSPKNNENISPSKNYNASDYCGLTDDSNHPELKKAHNSIKKLLETPDKLTPEEKFEIKKLGCELYRRDIKFKTAPDKNNGCGSEATEVFTTFNNICAKTEKDLLDEIIKKKQNTLVSRAVNSDNQNPETYEDRWLKNLMKQQYNKTKNVAKNTANNQIVKYNNKSKTNRPRFKDLLKSAQGEEEEAQSKKPEEKEEEPKAATKTAQSSQSSQDIVPYNDERQLVSINPPEIPEIDPKCKSRNVNNPNFDDKNICQHSNYIKVARDFHPDKNIKCDDKEKQRAKDIWNELQKTCKESSSELDLPYVRDITYISEPSHTFDAMNQELKRIIQNNSSLKDSLNNIHSNYVDFKTILKEFTIQLSVMKNDGKYADYVLDDVSRQLEAFADSIKDYDKEQIKEILKFLNENETTYKMDSIYRNIDAFNRKLVMEDKIVRLPLCNVCGGGQSPLFRSDNPFEGKVYPKLQLILSHKLFSKVKIEKPRKTDEEFLFAKYNQMGFVEKKIIDVIHNYQNTDFLKRLEITRNNIVKNFTIPDEESIQTRKIELDKERKERQRQNKILEKQIKELEEEKSPEDSKEQQIKTLQNQIEENRNKIKEKEQEINSYRRYNQIIESINPKLDEKYKVILTGLTDTDKLHSYLEYIQENQDKESGIGFFNSIPKFKDSNHIMSIDDKVPLFRIGSPNPIHKLQFQIPEEVFNAIKNKHYSKTNKLVERLLNAPILVSEEELKEVHENDIRESIKAVYQVHHTKDEGDKTDGIKIYHYISAIRALRNADNNPKYKNTQLSKSLEKLYEQMGGELEALDEKSTDLPYVRPDGNEFDFVEKKLISMYAPRTSENINEYDKSGFLGFLKREPIGQEAVEEKGDDELKEVVDPNTEEPSMDVKEIYQDKCRKNISKEKRILGVFDENCIFSEQRPRLYQKAPIIILKRKLRKALSELSKKGDNKIIEIKDVLFPVKGLLKVGNYKNLEEQTPEEFLEKLKVNTFFKQKTSATEKILLTQELTTRNKAGKLRVTLKKYKKFIADLLNNNITIGGAKKNYIANEDTEVEYNLNNGLNDKLNNELTAYMRNVANVSYDVNEKSKHIQKCFVDIGNPDAYNILGIVGDINGLNCLLQNKESFEFIERPVITITKRK